MTVTTARIRLAPMAKSDGLPPIAAGAINSMAPPARETPPPYRISEARFGGPMVNQWIAKAGFTAASDCYAVPSLPTAQSNPVDPDAILDLTSQVRQNGTLN